MPNSDLKKNLNTFDVLSVAFGAMIGWGWVVSSGQWITSGGVLGTVIGFLIGGLMIYFVGLAYAELTTTMPKSGGVQNFCYAAFGPVGAFVSTWALILSYVGVVCFEAVSFPTIIQYIFPGFLKGYLYTVKGFDIYASWLVVAIITAAIIVYINIKGTKKAAKLQNILTCIIAGVGLILVAGSAFSGNTDNISQQLFVGDNTISIVENVAKVAIMTPFFLFGFDVIPQATEEINMPLKNVIAKNTMLEMMKHYYAQYGLKNSVFRFPTIYSYSPYPYYFPNGVKTKRPVYQMIEKAMKGEPIEVYGDGTYSKDMVHVYDCAQELCKAVLANVDGGVYNVGTGIPVTIKEQIETIIEVFSPKDHPSEIVMRPDKVCGGGFLMDIENAKRDLGYQPKYSCKDLFEDYKKEMAVKRFAELRLK